MAPGRNQMLFYGCCVGIVEITTPYMYTGTTDRPCPGNAESMEGITKYYSIFKNTMATIVRNFGGEIISNAGEGILFIFPKTGDSSSDKAAFKDVLKCGLAMQAGHDDLNQKYYEEHIPPINYRISADYGRVTWPSQTNHNLLNMALQ